MCVSVCTCVWCPCVCVYVCHLFICAYSAGESAIIFSFSCASLVVNSLYFSYIGTMERVNFFSG